MSLAFFVWKTSILVILSFVRAVEHAAGASVFPRKSNNSSVILFPRCGACHVCFSLGNSRFKNLIAFTSTWHVVQFDVSMECHRT